MELALPTTASIRWAIRQDHNAILGVDLVSFADAWSQETLSDQLRQSNCICMVAEMDEQVIGYIVYEMYKTRLDIIRLAVDPLMRRKRVGMQLLRKLIDKMTPNRNRITVDVPETHLNAQLFFRAMGFIATKVSRAVSAETLASESVYVMEYFA